MRDADGWREVRGRLREVVDERGPTVAAAEIGCSRTALHYLLTGQTKAPSGPMQECIERFVDDHDLMRGTTGAGTD